jgi:hypothetical protein
VNVAPHLLGSVVAAVRMVGLAFLRSTHAAIVDFNNEIIYSKDKPVYI